MERFKVGPLGAGVEPGSPGLGSARPPVSEFEIAYV